MAFELSFSPEFFLAEGEPYDRNDLALNKDGKPISVWSALCLMRDKDPQKWGDMAVEVFECDGVYLEPEMVLDKINQTNACRRLDVPVMVYIDKKGHYFVEVWDGPEKER